MDQDSNPLPRDYGKQFDHQGKFYRNWNIEDSRNCRPNMAEQQQQQQQQKQKKERQRKIILLASFFKKWANPGLFLFIFVLFNNNFTEKL